MNKNLNIAEKVLENVGGKENVIDVMHCATRLRFHLRDESKVNEDALKKIDGVFGTMNATGMYQVIVGQNVEKVYDHLCGLGDFTKESKVEEVLDKDMADDGKLTLKKVGNNILKYVASAIVPTMPLIIGAGLWSAIGTILGPSLLNIISADSGLYVTSQLLYNAFFYFIPLYVGCNAAKALKCDQMWGILIGCLTIIPGFVSMVGTVETFSLFGIISVPVADYGSSLIPVLLGVWIFSYVNKLLKKIIPSMVFSIFAPIVIYFVMAIIMLAVCAPLGTVISQGISDVFLWMANSILPIRILAFAVLTALWPLLTLCGFHLPISLAAIALIATNGGDSFVLVCAVSSLYFVYGMALGAFFKFKKAENKSVASSAFVSGFVGSICEPILYGVCLKSKSYMVITVAGGAVMGVIAALLHPIYYNFSVPSIFTLFGTFAGGSTYNLIAGIIIAAVGVVLGTISVIMFGRCDE